MPGVGSGRTEIFGTYQITETEDGFSKRQIEGSFSVRAPLVGGSIERFILQQTTDAFERGAQYILSYLEDRG